MAKADQAKQLFSDFFADVKAMKAKQEEKPEEYDDQYDAEYDEEGEEGEEDYDRLYQTSMRILSSRKKPEVLEEGEGQKNARSEG